MSFTEEDSRKGGQSSRSHGVYSIKARGEEAMTEEQKGTFLEIEQGLETPEGIVLAMRRRVAMSVMVVGVLESYLEERINAGATPEGIDIFRSWPAFQNSAMRALAQLLATMPKPQADSYAEALAKVNQVIDEQVEQQQHEQVEQQQQHEQVEQIEQIEQHDHVEQRSREQQEQQPGASRHASDAEKAQEPGQGEFSSDAQGAAQDDRRQAETGE